MEHIASYWSSLIGWIGFINKIINKKNIANIAEYALHLQLQFIWWRWSPSAEAEIAEVIAELLALTSGFVLDGQIVHGIR